MQKCTGCGSLETVKLNKTGKQALRTVMSDGSFAQNFIASKHLCKNCGSIFINYSPPNRLEKFFAEEYNVSDEVQNCQVVLSGERYDKHTIIHNSVLNFCADITPDGHFLEIACGNGMLSNRFANEHPKWDCVALDPSIDSGSNVSQNVIFIKNFFDPSLFDCRKFDVIIAHGILNRTSTLKMLKDITSIANENALISLEVVTLENSIFAPYIWDHSYTFLEETFCEYLNSCGIIVQKRVDCGSTIQFLCRYKGSDSKKKLVIPQRIIESTHLLFQNHLKQWADIKTNFLENLAQQKKQKVTLFGAGLYNAVLLSLVNKANIDVIIDDVRKGFFLDDLKIINLKKAAESKRKTPVFLCARTRNINYIRDKLEAKDFSVVVLSK